MATFHNAHAVAVVVVQDYRAVGRSENLERGQTVMWGSQICPPPPPPPPFKNFVGFLWTFLTPGQKEARQRNEEEHA